MEIQTSIAFLGFMAGFAIFGAGIALLGHRRLKAIGREIDLTDPRQSRNVEYWRRIRGGGFFLLALCSALLYGGINAQIPDDLGDPTIIQPIEENRTLPDGLSGDDLEVEETFE